MYRDSSLPCTNLDDYRSAQTTQQINAIINAIGELPELAPEQLAAIMTALSHKVGCPIGGEAVHHVLYLHTGEKPLTYQVAAQSSDSPNTITLTGA
jgi:hypothetical protein